MRCLFAILFFKSQTRLMDLESMGKPRYADFYETEKIMRIWY